MNTQNATALAKKVRLDDLESDAHHMYQLADTIEDILLETDFGGDPNSLHSPKNRLSALMWILRDRLEQHACAFEALTSPGLSAASREATAKRVEVVSRGCTHQVDEGLERSPLLALFREASRISSEMQDLHGADAEGFEVLAAQHDALWTKATELPARTAEDLAAKVALVFRDADQALTPAGRAVLDDAAEILRARGVVT